MCNQRCSAYTTRPEGWVVNYCCESVTVDLPTKSSSDQLYIMALLSWKTTTFNNNIKVQENVDRKTTVFNGKDGKDYHLWSLPLKAAFGRKKLVSSVGQSQLESGVSEKPLYIIVPASGYSPLRTVQHCEMARDRWTRMQERHENKTFIT